MMNAPDDQYWIEVFAQRGRTEAAEAEVTRLREQLNEIEAVIPASLRMEVLDTAEAVSSTFHEYVRVAAEATRLRERAIKAEVSFGVVCEEITRLRETLAATATKLGEVEKERDGAQGDFLQQFQHCQMLEQQRDEARTKLTAAEAENERLTAALQDAEGKCDLARLIYASEVSASPDLVADAFKVVRDFIRAALRTEGGENV